MRIEILDQGYVELVEFWGSDERIIEAARMSTNKGFLGWGPTCVECGWAKGDDHEFLCSRPEEWKPGDEKLLRFLWENKHHTPFEMAGMTIEVKVPIMVFREWHRHRTQSYNEMSARYIPLPDENYMPTLDRLKLGGGNNKQAQGTAQLASDKDLLGWLAELADVYDHAQRVYEHGLQLGVPKEIARLPVPVARYSRMRASANLRNWFAFLILRMAPAAQREIRQAANAVSQLVAASFPRTHALFVEGMTK